MNQEEYNKVLNQYMSQIRELEVTRQPGDTNLQYTTDDLKKLMDTGKIPKEIGEYELKRIAEQNHKFKEWHKYITDNPNLTKEDKIARFFGSPRTLTQEEVLKSYEDMAKFMQIHNLLLVSGLPDQNESNAFPTQFFKTIQSDEFGMSRLIADPLNNIHKLLEKDIAPERINEDQYIWQDECENSQGDKIRLEYRFKAPNQEEANKQTQEYIRRLRGRQKKIYEACWALASKRLSRIITCNLTELLLIAYPDRKNKHSFSIEQKLECFLDMLDLSQTKLIVTKRMQESSKKKNQINSFLLPFITIHKTSTYNMASEKKSERYPNSLSFSVLHNPMYERESMYNVGAGLKHKTLELRPEDTMLAEYIQIRKSQLMTGNHIIFHEREALFKLAGLEGIEHVGMANKRLLDKFGRIQDKGIILNYPRRVTFPFHVKIR